MGRAAVTLLLLLPAAAPAPDEPADDHAFCRRVTLDLVGRPPAPDEIRAFVKSKDREKKIGELLASPEAALYHADLWMQWLLDHDFENRDFYRMNVAEFHAWLRGTFERPISETVRSLVAREGAAANFARKHLDGGEPPVKLAVLTARLFLGRDLKCAQCHDHPSQPLTQEDFWAFTAFFGGGRGGIQDHLGELRLEPRFLDGRRPEGNPLESLAGSIDPRAAIAERYWRLLMGRPRHPADLEAPETPRELLRAIVRTDEYRARKGPLKAMNSVQFMHAFAAVFDLEQAHRDMLQKALKNEKTLEIFKDEQVMRLFFHKWAKEMVFPKGHNPEEAPAAGTVRLALKLMNNQKVQNYVNTAWGTLRKVLARKVRAADRVEELFLTVIGRPPTKEERELFAAKDDDGFEDVFWALVNSPEFFYVS